MVPGDIYSTLQWLYDSGSATIQAACKETVIQTNSFQDITNQTLLLPVSAYTAIIFFANFEISHAEASDIFDQFISQELGCKSRAQGNI